MPGEPSVANVVLDELRGHWMKLSNALATDATMARFVFDDLVARHAEPARHYHTFEHIAAVVRAVHSLQHFAKDFVAVQLAAFFHDAVYDPRAADNEEQSAAYTGTMLLRLGVSTTTLAAVQDLILKTKQHEVDKADMDGQILLDADLAILGAPSEEYDRYARLIRQEYAWVPEEAYRQGRAAILRQFLQRPSIYQTEFYRGHEARARANLQREIRCLADPLT